MNEKTLNAFLLEVRTKSEVLYKQGKAVRAIALLSSASDVALPYLPKSHKVICQCGRQLRDGWEIQFYNTLAHCYTCEAAYSEALEQILDERR